MRVCVVVAVVVFMFLFSLCAACVSTLLFLPSGGEEVGGGGSLESPRVSQ